MHYWPVNSDFVDRELPPSNIEIHQIKAITPQTVDGYIYTGSQWVDQDNNVYAINDEVNVMVLLYGNPPCSLFPCFFSK